MANFKGITQCTKSQYNALTKDANTLYCLTDARILYAPAYSASDAGKMLRVKADGTLEWGKDAPLLNLNRTYEAGTVGESLANHLDESKAYINSYYGNMTFYNGSCTASNISKDTVTVKESGVGGTCISYAVHLPDLATQDYVLSFDYSGAGKMRYYYCFCTDAGLRSGNYQGSNDTAGASGTTTRTITTGGEAYTWLVLLLSSNTGNTKSYTNVKLEKA